MLFICTVSLRKRAHWRCTLHLGQIGGWADIHKITVTFNNRKSTQVNYLEQDTLSLIAECLSER